MARAELAQIPSFMSQTFQVISNHTNKTSTFIDNSGNHQEGLKID